MKSQTLKQVTAFLLSGIVVLMLVVVPVFVLSNGLAQAQSTPNDVFDPSGYLPGATNLPTTDLRTLVLNIINILLGILGIIFLLLVLYGGFLWMTAAGNDDQAAKGRKIIGNGIVGLIIIFVAFALTTFIFNILSEATA